jgi:hypothetical protein
MTATRKVFDNFFMIKSETSSNGIVAKACIQEEGAGSCFTRMWAWHQLGSLYFDEKKRINPLTKNENIFVNKTG